MLRNRLLPVASLLASSLLLGACDSSSGSLISGDIKDLLDPNAQTTPSPEAPVDSGTDNTTDNTTDNNARVGGDADLGGASPLSPIVNSVSSTITIRGADIVLLIQGSNLPDNLQINLDNDPTACEVSQLLSSSSNSNLANTLEAVCTTSAIVNRQVFVKNASGVEIQGSPLDFSAANISVDSSPTISNTSTTTTTPTEPEPPTTSPPAISSTNQDDEPIAGLSELAQTFIDAPTNLTLLDANAGIRVTWDSVAAVEGYKIYVSNSPSPQPGASGVSTYSSTQTTFEMNDVEVGDTYYLAVSAFLNNNESERSGDLVVLVTAATQSKYGALYEISGSGESRAIDGIVIEDTSAQSMDQSVDGRYTVFLSSSDNLTATALRGFNQVFLHDKETDELTLISQSASGEAANRNVSNPQISGDGSIVAFVSAATNLDRRVQTSGSATQVFISDRITASTSLISRSALASNRAANSNSFGLVIDKDGSNIVFASYADDLTSGSKTQSSHLYRFNVPSRGLTKLATHRDSAPAGATATVQADAISADGDFLFYQLSIPGSSPSLHRIDLQELTQVALRFDESVSLSGAYVHSVSNDANQALIGFSNESQTGLYSVSEQSLNVLGGDSANTAPKGLSGDGKIAVLWSSEDLLTNNSTAQTELGNHYILNTNTGYMRETELNIQSISNDGLVFLYTTPPDAERPTIQLNSVQQ